MPPGPTAPIHFPSIRPPSIWPPSIWPGPIAALAACLLLLAGPAFARGHAAPTPIGAVAIGPSAIEPATGLAAPGAYPANTAQDDPDLLDTGRDAGFRADAVDLAVARPGMVLQTGIASWYGAAWKGRRTSSGTRFDPEQMTAASHTLPLGTRVLVTLESTARSVLVTITDRQGSARRIIDLSKAAARKIGLLGAGTGRVVLRRA